MKNSRSMLTGLISPFAAVGPVLAFEIPQSRQEFVAAVSSGAGATAVEKLEVDRGIDEVFRSPAGKSSDCLDVVVKRSGMVGGTMEVSSSDYNPTLSRIDRSRAEFTLQVVHRPRGLGAVPPPGGIYVLAADIRSLGPARTELVLYRPTIGFKKIVNGVKQWAAGEDLECPRMR
jgi:hypothetical protein